MLAVPASSVTTASLASSSASTARLVPGQTKVDVLGEVLCRLDDLAGIQPMSRSEVLCRLDDLAGIQPMSRFRSGSRSQLKHPGHAPTGFSISPSCVAGRLGWVILYLLDLVEVDLAAGAAIERAYLAIRGR